MRLICSCGCGKELKHTKEFGSNRPAGYSYVGTPHDKNKRFYDSECARKWESLRKSPMLATVNGNSTEDYWQLEMTLHWN